jgi:hypothetical protein
MRAKCKRAHAPGMCVCVCVCVCVCEREREREREREKRLRVRVQAHAGNAPARSWTAAAGNLETASRPCRTHAITQIRHRQRFGLEGSREQFSGASLRGPLAERTVSRRGHAHAPVYLSIPLIPLELPFQKRMTQKRKKRDMFSLIKT